MMEETPLDTLSAARPDVLWVAYAYRGLDGYAYIFPKTHHVNVGIGCLLSHFEREVDAARLRRCSSSSSSRLVEAGELHGRSDRRQFTPFLIPVGGPLQPAHHGRVLFAGDAGGFVNAITAEGIYYAMVSGELAGTRRSRPSAVDGVAAGPRLRSPLAAGDRRRARRRRVDPAVSVFEPRARGAAGPRRGGGAGARRSRVELRVGIVVVRRAAAADVRQVPRDDLADGAAADRRAARVGKRTGVDMRRLGLAIVLLTVARGRANWRASGASGHLQGDVPRGRASLAAGRGDVDGICRRRRSRRG